MKISLSHPHYFPYLENISVIIGFVLLIGLVSLMFRPGSNHGAAASDDKKEKDKKNKHKEHKDPASDPTNFFDSTTASLTAAAASEDEPDSSRNPDNFFDSATNSVMGDESNKQLKQLDEVLAPDSFMGYFATGTLGIQAPPPSEGAILVINGTSPHVPDTSEVPLMSAKKEEGQAEGGEKGKKEGAGGSQGEGGKGGESGKGGSEEAKGKGREAEESLRGAERRAEKERAEGKKGRDGEERGEEKHEKPEKPGPGPKKGKGGKKEGTLFSKQASETLQNLKETFHNLQNIPFFDRQFHDSLRMTEHSLEKALHLNDEINKELSRYGFKLDDDGGKEDGKDGKDGDDKGGKGGKDGDKEKGKNGNKPEKGDEPMMAIPFTKKSEEQLEQLKQDIQKLQSDKKIDRKTFETLEAARILLEKTQKFHHDKSEEINNRLRKMGIDPEKIPGIDLELKLDDGEEDNESSIQKASKDLQICKLDDDSEKQADKSRKLADYNAAVILLRDKCSIEQSALPVNIPSALNPVYSMARAS